MPDFFYIMPQIAYTRFGLFFLYEYGMVNLFGWGKWNPNTCLTKQEKHK